MRRWISAGTVVCILFLILVACAPPSVTPPTTRSANTPSMPATSPATSNLTPLSSQDIEWQKIIDAAKREGEVTAYSFSMVGDTSLVVAKAFKDRYGINLDIISGRGAEFLERVKTEQRMKQVVGDFMEASSTHTLNLKSTGSTISTPGLPVFEEKNVWRINPFVLDPEGHVLVHRGQYIGPWVNTNLVKPGQEPKSYRDAGKPEWKGKILISDPALSNGTYITYLSLVDKGYLDMEFVRSMAKQDMKFVPGTRDVAAELAKGQAPLGLTVTDVDAASFVAEGAPIKAIAFEEGTIVSLSALTAIKGSPHPNASKVFMNWILSPEGQTIYNKALSLAPIRSDVPDFRPPPTAVVPKRVIPLTEEAAQRYAQAFKDKLLVELWRR
ncbi:MAG: Ferric transporter ATP-binding subunit [Dehalococcoidia bacterium]|nr:Ferric transporter ATP-binding subunit [Dehalococcoidia bacterium]